MTPVKNYRGAAYLPENKGKQAGGHLSEAAEWPGETGSVPRPV